MPKGKASSSSSSQATTMLIYLFLLAALGTYFLPLQSVTLPALGKKSWSVSDIVKSLPKGVAKKGGEKSEGGVKLDTNFDFMDFVKEITPKNQQTKASSSVSPEFIFGSLIPVALVLAYLFVIISLLVARAKKGSALIGSALIAAISAGYVMLGTFYLSAAAQKAFSSSLAKVEQSPFGAIAKNFVQEISIQPETGLYALVGLTILVLIAAFYRRNQG